MCYEPEMVNDSRSRKASAPVADEATTDDLPTLSEEERAELLRSLIEADARIDAGDFVVYDSATFRVRFEEIGRKVRRPRGT